MTEVCHRAQTVDENDHFVIQCIPVRLVTLVEVFYRAWIAKIIDHGDPYLRRSNKIFQRVKQNIDFDLIVSLSGDEITVGQIIGHLVSINSIQDVNSNFTDLFDKDFVEAISLIHDRWKAEVESKPREPIIGDPRLVWEVGGKLFRMRHILTHERTDWCMLRQEDAIELADFASSLLKASWEFFTNTLEPGYPLTQAAISEQAWSRADTAQRQMAELVERIEKSLSDDKRALQLFRDAQEKWMAFREANVIFRWDPESSGSIGPTIRGLEYQSLTEDRVKFLRWWLDREEGEM